jgi:hypothetical protein
VRNFSFLSGHRDLIVSKAMQCMCGFSTLKNDATPRHAFRQSHETRVMKPVTVDMLRAHLLVASLTAVGAEVLVCVALLVLPVSEPMFGSTTFRLLALALIVSGVIVTREFAQAAFDFALSHHYVVPAGRLAKPVAVAADCPRRWLVILHLRLTGQPFEVALP